MIDSFRGAGRDDRRYLLFNPVTKVKATSEGETVVTLPWDVLAAKGFEKSTYFAEVARLIGAPRRCSSPTGCRSTKASGMSPVSLAATGRPAR